LDLHYNMNWIWTNFDIFKYGFYQCPHGMYFVYIKVCIFLFLLIDHFFKLLNKIQMTSCELSNLLEAWKKLIYTIYQNIMCWIIFTTIKFDPTCFSLLKFFECNVAVKFGSFCNWNDLGHISWCFSQQIIHLCVCRDHWGQVLACKICSVVLLMLNTQQIYASMSESAIAIAW
jgi:hypothetical protein